ncbi:hypothetical protein CLAIMM_12171 [Cladophialophora immunda]|nr:hypothetical protein CLAIMM_12171 [Cladophialophora immunda]
MASPKEIHWGIMATGWIAQTFVKDLLVDPTTRNVKDIRHVVTAVASSSSLSSAEKFVSNFVSPSQSTKCTPYGSYEELVKDPAVDIIYIARHTLTTTKTPCSVSLTINPSSARKRSPQTIRKHITDNDIGEVLRVVSDLSIGAVPEKDFDLGHRMVNLDLAGGALLDLGVYALTWVFQSMYHTLPPQVREQSRPKVIGAAMTPEPRTGADESTLILLEFPKSTPAGKTKAHAVATTAMRVSDDPARGHDGKEDVEVPAVRIEGEKGEIQVYGPIYRPMRYRLVPKDKNAEILDRKFEFEGGCHGMMYEADAAARCLIAGELESETLPWAESTLIMEVMDEARKQGGLVYPDAIESTGYPVKLTAKA